MAKAASNQSFAELLDANLTIPKIGDVVKGHIIATAKNAVYVDIDGYRPGVVRGRELVDPSLQFAEAEIGDAVEATIVALENEDGYAELSFRFAGHRKAWDRLHELFRSGEAVPSKILEASKGGLLVRVDNVPGFLPVSQLSPENYPRVSGGDKSKILEKLKSFIGRTIDVRIIDANEQDEKLIVSEKAVWEERQKSVISKYKIGDTVHGEVSALADFGAFVKFDILEGLVHISEIAWQRIDHPRDLLKLGDMVDAEIIGIEGSKVFLSMKKLIQDPWLRVGDKYKVGEIVKGKVLKANPFGFFVELDPEIHGLAHVSELSKKPVADITTIAKPGETIDFMIVSVDPDQHRLGLSLKAMDKSADDEEETKEEKTEKKAKKSKKADTESKDEDKSEEAK